MSENGATPGIDLEALTRQWQELMMDGWSKMTKQTVSSDSFAAASSAYMDWALSWQKQMRNNTGQFLDSLEFPKRSDVARISKQVMAVEMRIADMEDRLDKVTGLLGAMSEAMQKMVQHTVTTGSPTPQPQATAPAKTAPKAPAPPKVVASTPAPAVQTKTVEVKATPKPKATARPKADPKPKAAPKAAKPKAPSKASASPVKKPAPRPSGTKSG